MSWPVPGALAFVCPRYGLEVMGGAETVVRELAERLVDRGLPVEVLTTCAVDHYTWDNSYPSGSTEVKGVLVTRFPVQKGNEAVRRAIGDKITAGMATPFEEQEVWLNNGFRSAHLFHYLMDEHHRYHTILLTPYMFWTTYACSQVAPHKNVLRPCLHDESFARLPIYRSMFRDARGVLFNSQPEADLALRLFDLPPRWEVVGEGVEVPDTYDASRFRNAYGIEGPFLVYAGRREWGKNVEWLIEIFERYLTISQRDLKLVLLGRGEVSIPEGLRSRVIDLGFVPDQDKSDALKAAVAACQPSRWESFSRVLMDAWLAEIPVLGFGGCAVTGYHIARSGGGLVFHDEAEFEVALDILLDAPELGEEMGRRGRKYVLENYTWEQVIDRFAECIGDWASEDASGASKRRI